MTHHIRRQYIQVDLEGTEREGIALQSRLSALCEQWLNPALEQVLDRCSVPGRRLCIDRLEVDAGTLTLENLEHELPAKVAQAVEKILREQVPSGGHASGASNDAAEAAELKNEWQAAGEALLHFLQTGRLPWSFRLPTGSSLEQSLREARQNSGEQGIIPEYLIPKLLHVLSAPNARRRLVVQFSAPFRESLLHLLAPGHLPPLKKMLDALPKQPVFRDFETSLWAAAFGQPSFSGKPDVAAWIAEALVAVPSGALRDIVASLKTVLHPMLPEFVRHFKRSAGTRFREMAPVLAESLRLAFGKIPPGVASVLSPESPKAQRKEPKAGAGAIPGVEAPFEAEAGPSGRRMAGDAAFAGNKAGDEIYVDDAGIVILHPFLQRFFEKLGVASEGVLTDKDRAMQLLYYLGTGRTPAPEYELTLPKILCNVPLEAPSGTGVALSDEDREECTQVLLAVVRWWEALRNTGIDALRGTFFCRPGKLTMRDDGDWLLQVERQGFDILLDQLPWGISVVRLPWMERMVWVEW